jgi:uncharacterized protein (TIGR02118 family)
MTVLRVCYKSGFRFDHGYYTATHLPLASAVMAPHGLVNVEVATFGSNPDGTAPPYQVMFSAYFQTAAGLQAAMSSPRIGEVLGDIVNYHDGAPDVLIGDVTSPQSSGVTNRDLAAG